MDGVGVHNKTLGHVLVSVSNTWSLLDWPVQDHRHNHLILVPLHVFIFCRNISELWVGYACWRCKGNDCHGPFISGLSRLLSLENILPFLPAVFLMDLHGDPVPMWNIWPPLKMDAFPIIRTATTKALCKRKKGTWRYPTLLLMWRNCENWYPPVKVMFCWVRL